MKTIKFANGAKFEFIDDPNVTPIRGLDYGWWYEVMNKKQKVVIKLEYRDNCYVLISGHKRKEQYSGDDPNINYMVSFLYDAGNIAAEWEPKHGPIQIWHKCDKNHKNAKEHYFYDYECSPLGSWSQLAVDRHQMKQALLRGDVDYIFMILKDWASDR